MSKTENLTVWDKLQSLDRRILYAVLIVLTASSLFFKVEIPVNPDTSSMDMYIALVESDPEKTVIIESDWTNSTRGESAGHFEALMRILMYKNQKFVVYSLADPQAPQVARDTMLRIAEERKAQNLRVYEPWVDYIDLGYFPNAEGQLNAMGNNIRTAWEGQKKKDSAGVERDIFESPVLQNINSIGDAAYLMIVTASGTVDIAIERLNGKGVPIGCMCTGVMGPQLLPYHQSRQITGVGVGLKGVYDVEYMMKYGLNYKNGGDDKVKVSYPKRSEAVIEPITEGTTFGRGARYFLPLHVALTLMIIAIVIGNLGLFFSKRGKK